ncbi:hypothetical protein FHX09_005670 [Rhizobium sp. BK538]|nr:hypothetical protein [Rhizobium sp. BK538]
MTNREQSKRGENGEFLPLSARQRCVASGHQRFGGAPKQRCRLASGRCYW